MGWNITLAVIAALLLWGAALPVSAEDDLFDTKAAVERLEKGVAHLKAKNYDAAIREFEQATIISPDAESYYFLGYAYYLKGKEHNDGDSRKKSIENFDKAYEINPNFTPSRYKPSEPVPAGPKSQQKEPSPAPEPKPAPEPEAPETPAAPEQPAQPGQP